MYDRTTSDCKLFKGAVTDLQDDCREAGYAVTPAHNQCEAAFDVGSDNECYVSNMFAIAHAVHSSKLMK